MILEGTFDKCLAKCCHFSIWAVLRRLNPGIYKHNKIQQRRIFSHALFTWIRHSQSHLINSDKWGKATFLIHWASLSLHLVVHSFNKCVLRAYHAKSFIFTILMQIFLKYFISFPAFYTKNAEHNLIFSLNEKTQLHCGTKP